MCVCHVFEMFDLPFDMFLPSFFHTRDKDTLAVFGFSDVSFWTTAKKKLFLNDLPHSYYTHTRTTTRRYSFIPTLIYSYKFRPTHNVLSSMWSIHGHDNCMSDLWSSAWFRIFQRSERGETCTETNAYGTTTCTYGTETCSDRTKTCSYVTTTSTYGTKTWTTSLFCRT